MTTRLREAFSGFGFLRSLTRVRIGIVTWVLALCFAGHTAAQTVEGGVALNGVVLDPSGARIPHASVTILGDHLFMAMESSPTGLFSATVRPGDYKVIVEARGFRRTVTLLGRDELAAGQPIDIRLSIATQDERVDVGQELGVSTSSDSQATLVLTARDLMALSDDQGTFQKELQAMAGSLGSAPSFYVDGFSSSHLPPKSAIQTIRISHDPYSAQYDALGFSRVEVESRAGGDKVHGAVSLSGTQQALNARDPFAGTQQPGYYVLNTDGNLSGPIDAKTTYFFGGFYNDLQSNAAVNALLPAAYTAAVPNPQTNSSFSTRADHEFSPQSTIYARYQWERVTLTNGGVGQLVLPSQGYFSTSMQQTLQVSHQGILSAHTVNQLRAEYMRGRVNQHPGETASGPCTSPLTASCSVTVQGSFAGGGDPTGVLDDHREHVEAEEFFSHESHSHFVRTGVRYRWNRAASTSTANFNGQFVFPSLSAYSAGQPSQFNLTTGDPRAATQTQDFGLFAQDEWRVRKDITLNYGVRAEYQTGLADHLDPAPRATIAWSPRRASAKQPLFVLRVGGGIFYDRFPVDNMLTSAHEDGLHEQIGLVTDAATLRKLYAYGFTSAAISGAQPVTYRLSPTLKPAYESIGNVMLDRRLGRIGSISLSYLWGRGVHQFLSENANAPAPGTGIRPLGTNATVYQFASDGIDKDHVGLVSWRLTPLRRLTMSGLYIAQDKRTSGQGPGVFASNSSNVGQDFGELAGSRRQQVFCYLFARLPAGISLNGYISAQSGAPFDITTGTDLNGDSLYNDRPSFATSASPAGSVVATRWGSFNVNPQPGETIIPKNFGTGPGLLFLSASMGRDFRLGGKRTLAAPGKPAGREGGVTLNFSVEADNLTNTTNAASPVGVLSSPLFGRSLAQDPTFSQNSAANRALFLRSRFSF